MWKCRISTGFSDLTLNLPVRKEVYQRSFWNEELWPFSAKCLPGFPSYLLSLVHFYFLVSNKPKRKCEVLPNQDILVYLILTSPCGLYRSCQFSGVERIRLVSLLVTSVAIWAGTCVCLLSPAGQGLCHEFADAPLGLHFRDSGHLLVICCYSRVGFQRLQSLGTSMRCTV